MAKKNSVEIILSADDQASKEIEKSVKKTTREFSSLNRSLKSVGMNSEEIDKINQEIRQTNPKILENELKNVETKLKRLGMSSKEIEKVTKEMKDAREAADGVSSSTDDIIDGFGLSELSVAGLTTAIIGATYELGKLKAETEELETKMEAATGATEEELAGMQASYKKLYESARGTKEEIAETLILTRQTFGNIDTSQLDSIANKALIIKDTFGIDVSESITAADVMMDNFGISSDRAFDLITRGAQEGLNRNGDLLDTMTEYSPQFAAMKYSANDFLAVLNNGMIAGARNTDVVADAVKEFNIRIKDGSDTTSEALENLYGKEYPALKNEMDKTGIVGKDAMQEIINKLDEVENPIERNQLGVALFGTKWEDMEEVAISSLNGVQGELSQVEGATRRAGRTIDNDLMSRFRRARNKIFNAIKTPFIVGGPNVPGYARGTDYHPGGLAVVGEEGPELVDLPRGSKVKTNSETERLLSTPRSLQVAQVGDGSDIQSIHAPVTVQINGGLFTGNKGEFKRFVENEIAPVINRKIGSIVLQNKKI